MNITTLDVSEGVGVAIVRLHRIFIAHSDFQQRIADIQSRYSPHQRASMKRGEEYSLEMLETIRAGRQANYFTEGEYNFYASFYVDDVHERRWISGHYALEIEPIAQRIHKIEEEYGLTDDEYWPIGEGPEEYQLLNREYEQILDAKRIATYRELGETQLATSLENDPVRFEALREDGRKYVFEGISEVERLRTLLNHYKREAELAFNTGAYYGACALVGACLETTLLLLCHYYPTEARQAWSSIPASQRPRSFEPNGWSLNHLIRIAATSGWLPILKAGDITLDVAGWVHLIRGWRNLLHPGNHLANKPGGQIGSQEAEDARAVFTVVEALFDQLEGRLKTRPA